MFLFQDEIRLQIHNRSRFVKSVLLDNRLFANAKQLFIEVEIIVRLLSLPHCLAHTSPSF